ncbi:MAG: GTP-binding protein [Oscillospiraceae bacterium]|nr:GTP-binding protein [Oscillospiraceae bacterium]
MTKVDVFSGFLGAGKTTLIKKLIAEAYQGEKLVLIENEFGEVGVDGGFMRESGIEVTEMSQGCICCSLVGDFAEALQQVLDTYAPERILIEPSGVGKLSDIIRAIQDVENDDLVLNSFTAVVDAKKCKVFMKNFGEFYNDQVEHASCIVLSRTADISQAKLDECIALLREKNPTATIVTTDWNTVEGSKILEAMEQKNTLQAELDRLAEMTFEDDECECDCDDEEHEHHHHHHEEEHEHHHHHHHNDDDDEHEHDHEHEHHHHDDDDDEDEHDHDHHEEEEHEHHHHHHHHHHHGHDADEVFVSFGQETSHQYTEEEIRNILSELSDAVRFGIVLRSKGIVASKDGRWIHFDYVPGETDIRYGTPEVTGRLCVIGSQLKEDELREVFSL